MFIMQSFNPGDWGKKSISAPYINSHAVAGSGHRFRFCCGTSVREVGHWSLVSYSTSVFLSAFSPTEYAENIGDGKNQEFRESEQKRIMDLLENF